MDVRDAWPREQRIALPGEFRHPIERAGKANSPAASIGDVLKKNVGESHERRITGTSDGPASTWPTAIL